MSEILCPDCEEDRSLGEPSFARWVGPDGGVYCSLHMIRRFGHGEKLIKINGYTPPKQIKPPAPKRAPREVDA